MFNNPKTRAVHHAVVRVKGCYLDADGVATMDEMTRRWKGSPGLRYAVLRPLNESEAALISCPIGAIREVTQSLEATFGPGEQVLEWAS